MKSTDPTAEKLQQRVAELEDELRRLRAQRDTDPEVEAESDIRFRQYFDIGIVGMVVARPNKEWIAVNDRLCEILGYTREQLLKKTWVDVTHPDDLAASAEVFQRVASGEVDTYTLEKRYIRGDGGVTHAMIALRCIRSSDGRVDRIVAAVTDITELRHTERELQETRQRMQQMLTVSPAVLYRCGPGPDFPTTFISDNVEGLFGYEPEQFYQDPYFWTKQIHPEDVEEVLARLARCAETGRLSYEYRFRHRDGHFVWLHDEISTMRDTTGTVTGLVGAWFDISQRMAVESDLRESKRALSTLLRNLPGMAYRCRNDSDWTMEFASDGCLDLTGYSAADLINNRQLSFAQLIHPDDRDLVWREVQEGVANGSPFRLLYRIRTAGGQEKWVWEQGVGVYSDSGELLALEGFITDMTERKRSEDALRGAHDDLEQRVRQRTLELTTANEQLLHEIAERQQAERILAEREGLLQAVLDYSQAVIYVKNVSGRYLLANRRYLELFQVSLYDVVGKTDFDISPRHIAEEFRANDLRALQAMKPVEAEEIALHDGVPHTYISLKFPLLDADGKAYAVCGISTDISDRKRAEAAITKAKEEAESANRAKNVFLANMSHEIRTPLTAMLAGAEMFDPADASAKGVEQRRQARDNMLRNGRHLLSLLNDLLDMARLESGKLSVHREDASLSEIVADVIAATGAQHLRSAVLYEVKYETPVPATIKTDATRLRQAIINLINNALKFTVHGSVAVRLAAERKTDRPYLTISIVDTGPGIPKDSLNHVFETFTQLESKLIDTSGGVGLGLPLAKWIAERLGGALSAQSTVGQGSTFTLTLPVDGHGSEWIQPSHVVVPHRFAGPHYEPARRTQLVGDVLLAEDFPDTRELICDALRESGVQVVAVADGRAAVQAADERQFDLIILDIRMPVMDGCEAVAALRKQGCSAATIALTASTDPSDHQRILAAGFDDVWEKPISMEKLLRRAADYLDSPYRVDAPRDEAGVTHSRRTKARINAVIRAFRRSLNARVQVIVQAIERNDLDHAGDELHKLVGSAGIHGLDEVSTIAAELLADAKRGSLRASAPRLQCLAELSSRIAEEASRDETDGSVECGNGASI